jgi:hypothetical protein
MINELERIRKEAVGVLWGEVYEESEEKPPSRQPVSQPDSKQAPPEYKSRGVQLDEPIRYKASSEHSNN